MKIFLGKKIYVRFVTAFILFLCSFNQAFGVVVERSTLAEISPFIDKKTIVLFDIDNTLIHPVQSLGSAEWFYHQYLSHLDKGLSEDEARLTTQRDWKKVNNVSKFVPVEQNTADFIRHLQKNGNQVIGLTARPTDVYALTKNQLNGQGIDLSQNSTLKKSDVELAKGIRYTQGILFVDEQDKGEALVKFFDYFHISPEKVVFVDDVQKNVEAVNRALEKADINVVAVRYAATDEKVKSFDPKIAALEWDVFETKHKLISDTEARKITALNPPLSIQKEFAKIETESDGRIGIVALNTENNKTIHYRANERFHMQSTMKLMSIAALLKQSMNQTDLLNQRIFYTKKDFVFWSPITEQQKNLQNGMTISELCAAVMSYSDNTATNLLIKKMGGVKTINSFAHSIGDNTFRLDNMEPNLNSTPGQLQDSTTPLAMEISLEKITLGEVLAKSQREQLLTWMKANTTGDTRIRAGVPKGWIVADKTGRGSYGVTNDIGIIWPPKHKPIIVVIYFTQNKKDAPERDDIIAKATHLIIDEFYTNILF